jgi:predicted O-methyltransferase YrrM
MSYDSPLPDIRALKKNLKRWYKEDISPGIDWNLAGQLELCKSIAPYSSETSMPSYADVQKQGFGWGYGEVEAHCLYMMLRHIKPARIMEVGSGTSTYFSFKAAEMNREAGAIKCRLTCIEPYPREKLRAFAHEHDIDLRACEAQDVEITRFQELSANDVLFIDSSHVSKKDSDVDFLILEVLPRLHKDVTIHFHDIPFPMPTSPVDHYLFDQYVFWNEPALLKAFLMFNNTFQIILCQSYLHYVRPDALKALVPNYNPQSHLPTSLWLRKIV